MLSFALNFEIGSTVVVTGFTSVFDVVLVTNGSVGVFLLTTIGLPKGVFIGLLTKLLIPNIVGNI